MESVFDRYLPIDVQIAAASPLEGLGVMVRLITAAFRFNETQVSMKPDPDRVSVSLKQFQ
jgi:hypothetical protein